MENSASLWSQRQRELLELLRTGNAIGAIQQYRTWTGLGLKEAKDAVDQLERTGSLPPPPTPVPLEAPPVLESRVVELLRAKQKIEAIKTYREAQGGGLKECKEAVEAIGRRHGIESSGGCAGLLFLAVLAGASLAKWLA